MSRMVLAAIRPTIAGTITAWIVDDMRRIRPTDSPGTATSITIEAARGEYIGIQPVVRATTQNLTNVRVTTSLANAEVYRESYINVPVSSPHGDWGSTPEAPGWFPDGLIPTHDPATGNEIPVGAELRAQNITITAGNNQPYWVDIFVPYGTAAGDHFGTVTILTDQGSATLDVMLHVWDFDLPIQASMKTRFGMWKHENSYTLQDYINLMHDRVQTRVRASYEPTLKQIGLTINDLGLFSQPAACTISSPPSRATLQSLMNSHTSGIPIYNYTADEITECTGLDGVLMEWGTALHAVGAKQLITMVPKPNLYSSVDYWPILPVQYVEHAPDIAGVEASGGEMWVYTALNQDTYSPKWMIDFSPMNYRIYGLINQSMSIKGLLYWTVDNWTADPWVDPDAYYGYVGEGALLYPGAKVGVSSVVPSMRLKHVRSSVQDYEYVEILKTLGSGAWALDQIRPIARDWQNWTKNPDDLKAVRHTLGERIESLS